MGKRSGSSLVLAQEPKRNKSDLMTYTNRDKALMESGIRRTSNLMAPIMLLEGHEGEVFTTEFHPDGDLLMSSGFDRQICKCCLELCFTEFK